MKYSIILLDYDPDSRLVSMRQECQRRIHEFSKGKDFELLIANEKGIQQSSNKMFAKAKGDYFIFMGNDMMVNDPEWLEKLSNPGQVTGWEWTRFHLTGRPELEFSLAGWPRYIYEKVGGFDEAFKDGYGYDDNDWLLRTRLAGYRNELANNLNAKHLQNVTHKTYYAQEVFNRMCERNRKIFETKWPDYATNTA